MPGLYSHISRSTGTVLTESVFNGDHINHVINKVFTSMDDYSTNVSQMQTKTDPYPGSVESLATSLAGELERVRYVLHQLISGHSTLQWYSPAHAQCDPVFRQCFSS